MFVVEEKLNIAYDCDNVMRNLHDKAYELFFNKYPEYKDYILPVSEFRGWWFGDQLKQGKLTKKINQIMTDEFFEGDTELSRQLFKEAEPMISPKLWKEHMTLLFKKFPNVNVSISTHQYTGSAYSLTMDWLVKHEFIYSDQISVLITGKKDRFGAHFLLDDAVSTIEKFNKSPKQIGVLYYQPVSNWWYLKNNKPEFPVASTLDEYYDIICNNYKKII